MTVRTAVTQGKPAINLLLNISTSKYSIKEFLWKVKEKKRANKQSSQSNKYIRKTFNS